jgi:hypothetical protein
MQFHLLLAQFHIQQVHVLFLMKILEKQQTILNRQAYLEKEILVEFLKVSWMMELLLQLRGLLVAGQQGDKEFLVAVEMLSRLHHCNLVKLVGY